MTFLAYEKPTININMKKYNFNIENCAKKHKIIYNRCQINIKDLKA